MPKPAPNRRSLDEVHLAPLLARLQRARAAALVVSPGVAALIDHACGRLWQARSRKWSLPDLCKALRGREKWVLSPLDVVTTIHLARNIEQAVNDLARELSVRRTWWRRAYEGKRGLPPARAHSYDPDDDVDDPLPDDQWEHARSGSVG